VPDHPFQRFGPGEQYSGLKAAAYDSRLAINNSALVAGVVQLFEVFVPETFDCTTIHASITTAAVTPSNAFAGIYDDQGALVGQTADQSTPWQSVGNKAMALVAPVRLHGQRRYYIALLIGAAGTLPNFNRASSGSVTNAGASAPFRSATSGSGLTALPASITLAGVTASSNAWWGGLS